MQKSGGQTYEDSLSQWLADRDVLLVLDNCEHVVSAVADLVEGLTAWSHAFVCSLTESRAAVGLGRVELPTRATGRGGPRCEPCGDRR